MTTSLSRYGLFPSLRVTLVLYRTHFSVCWPLFTANSHPSLPTSLSWLMGFLSHPTLAECFFQRHHSIYKTHFLCSQKNYPNSHMDNDTPPPPPMGWFHALSVLIGHYSSFCILSAFPHCWLSFRPSCVPCSCPSPDAPLHCLVLRTLLSQPIFSEVMVLILRISDKPSPVEGAVWPAHIFW